MSGIIDVGFGTIHPGGEVCVDIEWLAGHLQDQTALVAAARRLVAIAQHPFMEHIFDLHCGGKPTPTFTSVESFLDAAANWQSEESARFRKKRGSAKYRAAP